MTPAGKKEKTLTKNLSQKSVSFSQLEARYNGMTSPKAGAATSGIKLNGIGEALSANVAFQKQMRHVQKEKFDHKDLDINIDFEKKRLKTLKQNSMISTIESLRQLRNRIHFFQLYRSFDHQEH